jgi:O-antigen/teichoic acid export membrane protein
MSGDNADSTAPISQFEETRSTSSRKILASSFTSMIVRVCGLGIAFLAQVILSRSLGASQYGSYVIALGWAMVLAIPARLGLDNSALRFATVYREEGKGSDFRGLVAFSLAIIATVSLLMGASLLLAKAADFAPLRPIEASLLGGMALLIPFSALLAWLSALVRTANHIFASQFYEQVLRPSLVIVIIAFYLPAGLSLDAGQAMVITGVTVAIATIGIAVHARTSFAGIARGRPSFEHRREWLSVSWVFFLMAAVQELLNQVDVILLGLLGNATQAAHFAAAWRLASLVPFGLVAIVTVSGPLIASAHHRGDTSELARIARVSARFSSLFAAAIALLLIIFGKSALRLFGVSFPEAYFALLILLAGGLVNSLTGSVGYLLVMTGRQKAALFILIGALAVSLSVNLLLIPRFGATGAAIASSLALASWNLAMAIHVRRRMGVDPTVLGMPLRTPQPA